jgi:heme-degrading monooxygenase HmoA
MLRGTEEIPAMSEIAKTPPPPYYAVIFTNLRTELEAGYGDTAERMLALAAEQPGYLGVESCREQNGLGITVSYWESLDAIAAWKQHSEHLAAQQQGQVDWYSAYHTRIARVERNYDFTASGQQ